MKKQFLALGILIFLIGGIFLGFNFFSKEEIIENSSIDLPERIDTIPTQETSFVKDFAVLSKTGKRVTVRDFTNDSDTYEFTPTSVVIGSEESVEGQLYTIFYFPEDGSVTVSLSAKPFSFARELASEDLLLSLGVNEATLCSFDIWVSIPDNVSYLYSGQNLGLSFCPGSVSLE